MAHPDSHLATFLKGSAAVVADLSASLVNPKSLRTYNTHLNKFNLWFQSLSLPAPKSFPELDSLLAQYCAYCYSSKATRGSRQSCVFALSAILLHCPEARNALPLSRRVLAGWDKRHPSTQNTPCPFELVLALADHFLQRNNLECGVLVLFAADTYLRVSELLTLTPSQICLPSNIRPGAVSLPISKGGRNQSVVLRSPTLITLLKEYLKRRSVRETLVFSESPLSFNAALRRALADLGVDSSTRITAHSLRHGGATHDFICGVPLADIVQRGRWKDPRTAQIYIQSAQSLLLSTKLPNSVLLRAQLIAADPAVLLRLVDGVGK